MIDEMETVNNKTGIREKIAMLFTNPFFIIEVIILCSFLMYMYGGLGYILGIIIAVITLWALDWDLSYFGIGKVKWWYSLKQAVLYTLIIILLNDLLLSPIIELYLFQDIDLSAFDSLRGNTMNLFIMLLFMWIAAAFGEEFLYRGYLMKRSAILLGNTKRAWIIALFISATIFGFSHAYQGPGGILTTGLVGLILAYIFYEHRENLMIPILTHGIYDSYGIYLIYLSKDQWPKEFVQTIIQSTSL